jgi:hypothetical protein
LGTERVLGWLFGEERLDQDRNFRNIANFVVQRLRLDAPIQEGVYRQCQEK